MTRFYEIAGAIADDRAADSTQVGNHQLALMPELGRLSRRRIDDFDDEFIFIDMNGAGLSLALKAKRAHFSGPRMIEALCAPRLFDQFFGARNARARLPGMDRDPYS